MTSAPDFSHDPTAEELARVLCFFDRTTRRLNARGLMTVLLAASDEMVTSTYPPTRQAGRMIRQALGWLNQDFREEKTS